MDSSSNIHKHPHSKHFGISIDFYLQGSKYWFPNAAVALLKLVFDRDLSQFDLVKLDYGFGTGVPMPHILQSYQEF